MKTFNSVRATQRGVSMIEILVTLFVLAVGLLGVAGLQLLSLQTHHGAYTRTQATNIAYAVSDVARANRSAVLAGSVDDDVLAGWIARSGDMIAGVDVDLDVINAATGEVRITVSWLDDRADGAPDEGVGSFVLTTRI
jgi:type IV pilus assembly protein PilV